METRKIDGKEILLTIVKSILLATFGMFFPIIYIYFPQNFLYLGIKDNIFKAGLVFIIVAAVLAVTFGTSVGLSVFTIFLPMILLMHYMITTKRPAKYTVLVGAVAMFVSLGTVLYTMGITPEYLESGKALQDFIQMVETFLKNGNVEMNAEMTHNLTNLFNQVVNTFPAILLIGSIVTSYFTLSITGNKLLFNGIVIKKPNPFYYFKLPKALGFAALIIMTLNLGFSSLFEGYESYILNISLIFSFFFMAEGLSLIYFYLKSKRVSRFILILVFMFSIYITYMQAILGFLGILDSILNFRKLPDEVI